jgi:RNA recognition motif-containing protein
MPPGLFLKVRATCAEPGLAGVPQHSPADVIALRLLLLRPSTGRENDAHSSHKGRFCIHFHSTCSHDSTLLPTSTTQYFPHPHTHSIQYIKMASTVNVENISTKTSEDEIKSFFSFCGKIQSISVKPSGNDAQSASVTFEKLAAAKTALLLDNTQLGPNSVQVSSAKPLDEVAGEKAAQVSEDVQGDHHIEQEQKPRARIFAEYLAHGYVISDKAIESALATDKQHGYSSKFTQALQNFDSKTQASQKAQAVDNKLGLTQKAYAGYSSLMTYFEKAANTPTGQKLRSFYETGNKTVMDVHNEARYLADLKKKEQGGAAGKSNNSAEEMNLHSLPPPNQNLTQCDCAADDGKCACEPGKCACKGCGKSKDTGNDKVAA